MGIFIMNNRDYKDFAQGNYYHIYNRGNEKDVIFREGSDYALFLSRMRENLFPGAMEKKERRTSFHRKDLPPNSFSLACYCLMPNHFHLLIKQCAELPLSKLLSKACTGYSKYFNSKYERIGHVFQDQFKAILVNDNEYLLWLSAYIHGNPVAAGLAVHPGDWRWSSFGEYVGQGPQVLCDTNIIKGQFATSMDYERFVVENSALIREKKRIEHLLLD